MIVRQSARKHGVIAAEAVHAVENALMVFPLNEDDYPHKHLYLGVDSHLRVLEVVVLTHDDGEQWIIHAMKCRKQYLELLQ